MTLSSPSSVGHNSNCATLRIALSYREPRTLRSYPGNPRIHPRRQLRKLARNIETFGFVVPVLIDRNSTIIAGDARIAAALLLDLREVPVVQIEHLSPAEVRALRLADNRLAEEAEWNPELLKIEFEGFILEEGEFDVTLTGFEVPEIDLLMTRENGGHDPDLDAPEPVKAEAISQAGDLWVLGDHRLLCGDALVSESYTKLLGDQQAGMMISDPPYNVRITGHVSGLGRVTHREFPMATGEMSPEAFTAFLKRFMGHAAQCSRDGAVQFIFMDWRHMREVLDAGNAIYGNNLLNLVIWNKTNAGMGSLYRSRHELIFVYKCGQAPHINNVQLGRFGRYRSNMWTYAGANSFGLTRDQDLEMHPTVKPVALISDAILDCSEPKDIILDCFGGSGTTLIAAQKTGRRARLIELDPCYVDVTIRRWQRITGQEAFHTETGESFSVLASRRCAEAVKSTEHRELESVDGKA